MTLANIDWDVTQASLDALEESKHTPMDPDSFVAGFYRGHDRGERVAYTQGWYMGALCGWFATTVVTALAIVVWRVVP